MKYWDYEVEDYVTDESFQSYVRGENDKDILFWENIVNQHPELTHKIKDAKNIVNHIQLIKPEISQSDYENEYLKFQQTFDRISFVDDKKSRSYIAFTVFKFAAVFAFVFGFGYFIVPRNKAQKIPPNVKYIHKYNPAGQKSTIFLDDGTTVVLNSDSRIIYPEVFSSENRSLILEGEAYFDVAKDNRAFEVTTGNLKTIVVGTSFNISYYKNDHEATVALVSGKVIVLDTVTQETTKLNPGEKVDYKRQDQPIIKKFNPDVELGWKNGEIVFVDADIEEVIKRLERWYGVSIEIHNNQTENWTVKGRFKNQSLRRVLESLSFTQGFEFTLSGEKVVIYL